MRYQVAYQGQATAHDDDGRPIPHDPDELERHLEEIQDQLLELDAADATVSAVLASGEVEISVTVEAPTVDEAAKKGSSVIRTAIHAAGGFTPNWSVEWLSVHTDRVDALTNA